MTKVRPHGQDLSHYLLNDSAIHRGEECALEGESEEFHGLLTDRYETLLLHCFNILQHTQEHQKPKLYQV